MHKDEIIHHLAVTRGYQEYLELRTGLTGADCSVDPSLFLKTTLIRYQVPPEVKEGVPRKGCLDGKTFDLAMIDPWHTYRASYFDLQETFQYLKDGGALVCHDVWPTNKKITEMYHGPENCPCLDSQPWSGFTFIAFIDFIIGNQSRLQYFSLPSDYGCGVVLKQSGTVLDPRLVTIWQKKRTDPSIAYDFLAGEGRPLLKMQDLSCWP